MAIRMRKSERVSAEQRPVHLGEIPPKCENVPKSPQKTRKTLMSISYETTLTELLEHQTWQVFNWMPPETKESIHKLKNTVILITEQKLAGQKEEDVCKISKALYFIGLGWVMPKKPQGLFCKSNAKNYKSKIKISKLKTALKNIQDAAFFLQTQDWINEQMKIRSKLSAAATKSFVQVLNNTSELWNSVLKKESAHIEDIVDIYNEKRTMELLITFKQRLETENIKLNKRAKTWEKRSNIYRQRMGEKGIKANKR